MKGQKFPKPTEKHAKALLFSGFFAVFVSRETDAENQTVPRETYIFHYLKYPFRYRFCARFYSLIVAVLHLKSYVKNGFHASFLPQIIHIQTPRFRTKSKPFSQRPSRFHRRSKRPENRLTDNISHAFSSIYHPRRTPPVARYGYRFAFIHIRKFFKKLQNRSFTTV